MAKEKQVQQRVFTKDAELTHDLFKLELSHMKKNLAFQGDPIWEAVEHVHFFRTIDSMGRKLTVTNAVGNHFHQVKVIENGDGVPTIEVSPPMRNVKKGKQIVVAPVEYDTHTHPVRYMGSQLIKGKQVSAEYVKYEAALNSKRVQSVDGVE